MMFYLIFILFINLLYHFLYMIHNLIYLTIYYLSLTFNENEMVYIIFF